MQISQSMSSVLPSPVPTIASPGMTAAEQHDVLTMYQMLQSAVGDETPNPASGVSSTQKPPHTTTPCSTRAVACALEAMESAMLMSPDASFSKDSDEENVKSLEAVAKPILATRTQSASAVHPSNARLSKYSAVSADCDGASAPHGIDSSLASLSINQFARKTSSSSMGAESSRPFTTTSAVFTQTKGVSSANPFATGNSSTVFGTSSQFKALGAAPMPATAAFPPQRPKTTEARQARVADAAPCDVPARSGVAIARTFTETSSASVESYGRGTPEPRTASALSRHASGSQRSASAVSDLDADADVDPDPVADAQARAQAEIDDADTSENAQTRTPLHKRSKSGIVPDEDTSHSRHKPRPPKAIEGSKPEKRRPVKCGLSGGSTASCGPVGSATTSVVSEPKATSSAASTPAQSTPTASSKSPRALVHVPSREGCHKVTVSNTTFEIDSRYTVIKPVGHGSYGVVVYVSSC
jgi:hypothetical protein